MTLRMLKTALLTLCLFAGQAIYAQSPEMQPLPIDSMVRYGVLDNGLTYYVRHNETPKQRVEFHIAQKVGSVLEEENQRGLAHFLEHMAFNGLEHFPGKTMLNYLEENGIQFGSDINAYTGFDQTVYRISNVPSDRSGLVDSCLLILHDWACAIALEDKEIDEERGVIQEEWRTRADANWRQWESTVPVMFEGSQYANRMPIGTMDVVMNFPYKTLRDYYHKWYRPDQQGIIVIGDIDAEKIENQIKTLFGSIKMPENAAERIYYPVPDNKEPIVAIYQDKEAPNAMASIYFKHEPMPREIKATQIGAIYGYLQAVAQTMLNNRLTEIAMQPEAPFVGAYAYDSNFFIAQTKDAFTLLAEGKEDAVLDAMKGVLREAERVNRFGFTSSEYERAKAELLSRYENMYNERNNAKNISYAEEYINHFLEGGYIPGIEFEYNMLKEISPLIPLAQVNQYIQELIGEENIVITITGPEKEGLVFPTKEEVIAAFNSVSHEDLEAYEDNVSDEPLIDKEVVAGSIVKEKANVQNGTTEWYLSNGVKVVLKPTDFKSDEILLSAVSHGGKSLYTDKNDVSNLKVINDIIELSALGNHSYMDMMKLLAGKNVSAHLKINDRSEAVTGSCGIKDMETMFQLVYLYFTGLNKDEQIFNVWKTQAETMLANRENDPSSMFNDSISAALYDHQPAYMPVKVSDLEKIDYNRIIEIAKERTANAADFTFSFVGSFKPEELKPFVEKYIASLPVNKKKEKAGAKTYFNKNTYSNLFEQPMETPKTSVFSMFDGNVKNSLKNELMMDIFQQTMDIIYTETIREEEGGTYGVGTAATVSKSNGQWIFYFAFDTNADQQAHLAARAKKELLKYANEGVREQDFNKVKEYMLKTYNNRIRENGYWKNVLDAQALGTDNSKDYENVLKSITREDVQKFTQKLFKKYNNVDVIMLGVAK